MKMSEANLIGITQPNEKYTGCKTANELIAWVARVSNPSNQNNVTTAPKLVQYLIKNNHWSPLEMVHVSIEIRTTRDIARQILRHRSFTFQEYSQRYADPTKDLGFITRDARLLDLKNRQNSVEIDDDYTYDKPHYSTTFDSEGNITDKSVEYEKASLKEDWEAWQKSVSNASLNAYNWAIERGIAKEQARSVLPEGMTESVVIMAGSLRSWVHYCQLRMDVATQKEHRIVAEQCWNIIIDEFPDVQKALDSIKVWEEFEKKLP